MDGHTGCRRCCVMTGVRGDGRGIRHAVRRSPLFFKLGYTFQASHDDLTAHPPRPRPCI